MAACLTNLRAVGSRVQRLDDGLFLIQPKKYKDPVSLHNLRLRRGVEILFSDG